MKRDHSIVPLTVRPAEPADLTTVRNLLSDTLLPVEGLEDQFGEAYVIIEQDGSIVGSAGVERHGDLGLLRSVAVLPKCQGRGIAHKLVSDRLAWARRSKLTDVYLLTATAPRYFDRFGFEECERENLPEEIKATKEFAEVCPDTAVVMKLTLNGG